MSQRASSDNRVLGQANMEAARALTQATRELTSALRGTVRGGSPFSSAERDSTAAAVASGVLMGLRRAQQDPIIDSGSQGSSSTGIPGMGYGRMGASITGSGQRASTYGAIGGAIGYAVGGPVGGLVGGMLGGLLGGGSDSQSKPPLQRQWYNTPEQFEIDAYLYNLKRGGTTRSNHGFTGLRVDRVEITINGQGAQAGLEAGRAFASYLGRHVALNSAVAQAPGYV